jgi:hypothetical protein
MKLRIKTNSLRYRLTKSDVNKLTDTGNLEDSVSFGARALHYAIEITVNEEMSAVYLNNTVTLFMPRPLLEKLATTDKVGFENMVDGLHLLVEKDFVCMDKIATDQDDYYPNPEAEKYLEEEG